jgi:hypothetical protein
LQLLTLQILLPRLGFVYLLKTITKMDSQF